MDWYFEGYLVSNAIFAQYTENWDDGYYKGPGILEKRPVYYGTSGTVFTTGELQTEMWNSSANLSVDCWYDK